MRENLPKDFSVCSDGPHFTVVATITTQHELRAVLWAMTLLNSGLSSHRKAVAGDFGLPEPEPQTYLEILAEAGL